MSDGRHLAHSAGGSPCPRSIDLSLEAHHGVRGFGNPVCDLQDATVTGGRDSFAVGAGGTIESAPGIWWKAMMPAPKPDVLVEIFLKPGDLHFGGPENRIRTVLGSCVSLVFWHPLRQFGGMCHYLLPTRNGLVGGHELDGRYADEALELLLREIRLCGTQPADYRVKLFGGGDMFPKSTKLAAAQVGRRNVEAARELIQRYHLNCVSEHLEGIGHRSVIFEVWSGKVWLKQQDPLVP